MDGVDDNRDAREARSDAPEDACLGAVRVDDVRLLAAEEAAELERSEQVEGRMEVADKLRDDHDGNVPRAGLVEEVSLRTRGLARNEGDVVAAVDESFDGEERILLRPADNQTRDDVDDLHYSAPGTPILSQKGSGVRSEVRRLRAKMTQYRVNKGLRGG